MQCGQVAEVELTRHLAVKCALKDFIEQTGADELMISSQAFDHAARLGLYQITEELRAALG